MYLQVSVSTRTCFNAFRVGSQQAKTQGKGALIMPKRGSSRHRQLELLSEKPDFQPGHQVARIAKACGENIYEAEKGTGETVLYQLPSRLRNVAFIRRGSYVFVRDDPTRGPGKVRGDIEVVVLDRYLKDLRKQPFWPLRFNGDSVVSMREQDADSDDEQVNQDSTWEIGAGNPNRPPFQDDEHSESEDDDE